MPIFGIVDEPLIRIRFERMKGSRLGCLATGEIRKQGCVRDGALGISLVNNVLLNALKDFYSLEWGGVEFTKLNYLVWDNNLS